MFQFFPPVMSAYQSIPLRPEARHWLLAMQGATRLPSLARALRGLSHALVPPLSLAVVVYRPLESPARMIFPDPGSEAPWRPGEARAALDDLWPHRHPPQPHVLVVRFSDDPPDRRLVRSKFYRTLMKPAGLRYGAVLQVWAGPRLVGCVLLHRGRAQGDFTDQELRCLRAAHPFVNAAVKRVMQDQRELTLGAALKRIVGGLTAGVVLLNWDLKVRYANAAASEQCARWEDGEAARCHKRPRTVRVPAPVLAAAGQLRDAASGPTRPPAGADGIRVSAPPAAGDLHCHLSVVPGGETLSRPLLLLRFAAGSPATPTAAGRGAGGAEFDGLTAREREIADLVCVGRTNREIAAALHKSDATVRNQLHVMFAKLEVTRRGELAAQWRA